MAFNNIGANKEAEEEMQRITEIQENMQSQQQQQQTEQPEDATSIEEEIEQTKPESENDQ